jgi:hypothetical protein
VGAGVAVPRANVGMSLNVVIGISVDHVISRPRPGLLGFEGSCRCAFRDHGGDIRFQALDKFLSGRKHRFEAECQGP